MVSELARDVSQLCYLWLIELDIHFTELNVWNIVSAQ